MNLLLDTHVLLWWTAGDRRLPRSLRDLIQSEENDISISAASFWEIAIKIMLGRIRLDLVELRAAASADGFNEMPVQVEHTLRLQALPAHHQDPFDRLLIAQSIDSGRRLVTRDEEILRYTGVPGFDPVFK